MSVEIVKKLIENRALCHNTLQYKNIEFLIVSNEKCS